MGNACTASSVLVCESSNSKDSVIVLQANGEVMKINRKIRAGELMADYPQHFLCHASTILLRRKSKMIPAKALLQGGKIYLLLPFPTSSSENTPSESDPAAVKKDEQSEERNPLLRVEPNATQGTTKFVISKHYLERILSEKQKPRKCARRSTTPTTSKKAASKRSSGKENAPLERRSSITWSPALESIPESPLK